MAMFVKLFAPAVRSSSAISPDVTVWETHEAAHIIVDHPNVGGGLTVDVFGKDPSTGFRYPLLSSNIVTSGHTVMKIGPQYTAAANIAKDYIPYTFFVSVTASGTNAYGISASVI